MHLLYPLQPLLCHYPNTILHACVSYLLILHLFCPSNNKYFCYRLMQNNGICGNNNLPNNQSMRQDRRMHILVSSILLKVVWVEPWKTPLFFWGLLGISCSSVLYSPSVIVLLESSSMISSSGALNFGMVSCLCWSYWCSHVDLEVLSV